MGGERGERGGGAEKERGEDLFQRRERKERGRRRRSSPPPYAHMRVREREENSKRRGCKGTPLPTLLLAMEFLSRERERSGGREIVGEKEIERETAGERKK